MSTERPILFSGPMVRAILDGRKTQTRRVMKPQPAEVHHCQDRDSYPFETTYDQQDGKTVAVVKYTMGEIEAHFCPYGQPGDRLWVRETFAPCMGGAEGPKNPTLYRADALPDYEKLHWKPSIFLPRWASRITLEITSVCVERVQDISEADAIAEGIEVTEITDKWTILGRTGEKQTHYKFYGKELERLKQQTTNPVWSYQTLWDTINKERGFGWDKNPWVWAIEFRKL